MTNSQIPPTQPPQMSTQVAAPVSAASPVVRAAPVLGQPPQQNQQGNPYPRKAEGRVASSSPQGSLRIATPQGTIDLQSDARLPANAEVSVELYQQDGLTLANVRIRHNHPAPHESQPSRPAATPAAAPPLRAGDTVEAVILPAPTAAPTTDALPQEENAEGLPPALQVAARVLDYLKTQGTDKIPLSLPLPVAPETFRQLMAATDVEAALSRLPLIDQARIEAFITQPNVAGIIDSMLASRQAAAAPATSIAASAAGEKPADIFDANMLQIIKAQISARMTHDSLQPSDPSVAAQGASHPLLSPGTPQSLRNLLPLIENMESLATPLPAFIRQFVPPGAMAQMQQPAATPWGASFMQMKIVAITPPAASGSAAPPEPAPAPPLMTGTVDAFTPGGSPIIDTGSLQLVLRSPAEVALGSRVTFEATPLSLEQVAARDAPLSFLPAALSAVSGFEPLRSKSWPAMQETLQSLAAQAATAGVATTLRNTLPTPTRQMVPTALFFLAALRSGNIESWLGPNVLQGLRDIGRKDTADKLGSDFARISSQSRETLTGEWRAISMPLLHDQQLTQMQMFVRRQKDEREEGDEAAGPVTRFLLNLSLSRMGDLQLDGLMRGKQLDVILRSGDNFPAEIRHELMQAFARGMELSGLQGSMGFQAKAQHWVTVEMPHHESTLA